MGKSTRTPAVEFLKALWRPMPMGLIELRAIPVDKSRKPHRMFTRRASDIAEFALRYGGRDTGYGVYYGVCRRAEEGGRKEHVLGATALWADVDCEVNGITIEAALDAIGKMPADVAPSAIVNSGGGVHCFWFLDEVVRPDEHNSLRRIEDANKVVRDLVGGDNCWDVTRVLRLPDTYNNKRPAKKLCHVVYCAEHLRYDLDTLLDRVLSFGKVLHGGKWIDPKKLPRTEAKREDDAPHWFEKSLFVGGQRLPARLDRMWEDRVRSGAPRGYIGVHEATIVTAARLHCAGYDEDAIVEKVLRYQQSAPGVDTEGWDWQSEERSIRRCLATWGDKWKTLKKQKRSANGRP